MAPQFFNPPQIILLLLLLISDAATATTGSLAAFQSEMETMTEALRIHGSTLFTNAIATTDLQYQLLSSAAAPSPPAFTIFAPKDSLLQALDIISDSSTYISTLRYHVIPHRRHTFLHLQNLSSPFLQTLLPHYSVLVGKTRESDEILLDNTNTTSSGVSVMVDGVRISAPDLFLGKTLAVHGIDGILVTGLNMYQDFDLDPGTVSISSPPPHPPPPPPSVEYPAPFDYRDAPTTTANYYDSPTWPPAESPISSSAVFDEEGLDPPAFSDQDPLSYWDTNSNDWMVNDGDGNVMMDYDGSGNREEAMKKINFVERKRMRKVTEKRRRLCSGHRHHLLDL